MYRGGHLAELRISQCCKQTGVCLGMEQAKIDVSGNDEPIQQLLTGKEILNVLKYRLLFDCDRLGEIARLVDIGALEHRHVIGQQLQRHRKDNRRNTVLGWRYR